LVSAVRGDVARVFVSHATADLAVAEAVCDWLRGERHQVFLDRDLHDGLRAGEQWKPRLYRELRGADAVVCVMTAAYLQSAWCTREMGIADALGSRLLPLQVTPEISARLLPDLQYIEYGPGSPWQAQLAAVLRDLDAAGGLGWADDRSPFPGLRPFDIGMARAFCGRADEVRRLAGRLRSPGERAAGGLLVVVGPSGCGKSSLVRAGLAARMAAEPDWEVAHPFLPGSEPVGALAWALTATANRRGLSWTVADTRAALERDDGLSTLADEVLVAGPGAARERLLLVVDQAEELLTRADAAGRARMTVLLRSAAAGRVRPVLTLRSELQDRFLALAGIEVDTFALRPLSREMLRVVIEEPARLAGLSVDHELVDRLVADTDGGEALPLLAFTLNRLSDGLTRGDALSAARYEEIGGVQGALARHADAALTAAVDASGLSADKVLSALVRLAALDAAGQPTRRRIAFTELSALERAAFAPFVDHRLLTTAGGDDGHWVGVAHEALLTTWQPLANAINDRRVAKHTARLVEQAAVEWDHAGRPDDHLWERGRVTEARHVLDPADISRPAAAFLRAGQRHGDRVRIRTIALLSVALLLVSAGGIAAVAQWRVALSQRGVAVGRQVVGQALVLRQSQPRLALELSMAAYRLAPSLPEARETLLNMQAGYYGDVLLPEMGAAHSVAFGLDGRLATAQHDRAVAVWQPSDRFPLRLPTTGPVYSVAFSPNGKLLAAAGEAGTVEVWDAVALREQTVDKITVLRAGRDAVYSVAFSPDSTVLAVGGSDDDVVLWGIGKGRRFTEAKRLRGSGAGSINGVAFSPDGHTLVTASSDPDAVVTFWDIKSGIRAPIPGHSGPIRAVAFSPDGSLLASGGSDGSVRLWDAHTHALIATSIEHTGAVQTVAFGDSGTLASGGDDGSVRLWDAKSDPRSPSPLTSLLGPTDRVLGVAFSRDGRTLASAGSDSAVGLWNVSGPPDASQPAVYGAATFGPDGIVATAGRDRAPLLWDTVGGHGKPVLRRDLSPPRGRSDPAPAALGMAFSADGKVLVTPEWGVSTALWDLRTGKARYVPGRSRHPVHAVALSPQGDYLASASERAGGDVDLRSTSTLSAVTNSLTVHTGAINGVALSSRPGHPDGLLLATASEDGYIAVSAVFPRMPRRTELPKLLPEYATVPVKAVALSHDGAMLAGGSADGVVRLWGQTGTSGWDEMRLAEAPGPARPVVAVAFSRDGTMLGAVGGDGVITLWDLTTSGRNLAATLTGPLGTTSIAFRPDGDVRTFVTADQNGTPMLWETNPDRVARRFCSDPRLSLTLREWSTFVPGEPYRQVCR
jgi:WD40 repeat protein